MTQYTDRTGNRKAKAGSTSPDFAKSSCATIRVWCVAVLRGVRGGIFDREFFDRGDGGGGESKSGSARNDAELRSREIADDVRDTVNQLHLGYIARARPPPWENKTGKRN